MELNEELQKKEREVAQATDISYILVEGSTAKKVILLLLDICIDFPCRKKSKYGLYICSS